MDDLLTLLKSTPESQLSPQIREKVEKWVEPVSAINILEVLDDVVHTGGGSGFIVKVFDLMLTESMDRENTFYDDLVKQAHWRVS